MMEHVSLRDTPSRRVVLRKVLRPTAYEVWDALSFLNGTYPDFRAWYWGIVIPGLVSGERRLFVERHGDSLSGLVIAKRSDEQKLCTIWTRPELRGRGVATRLMHDALEWLGTDRPLVTVPDETLESFNGLFRNFGFEHRYAVDRYYRDDSAEHVFNGNLRPARPS